MINDQESRKLHNAYSLFDKTGEMYEDSIINASIDNKKC